MVDEQVKVTFFCPELPERKVLSPADANGLRVATVAEIFALKALVSAKRSKTRDWFDLYILMKFHGFRWRDFYAAFVRGENGGQYDYAAHRLWSGQPSSLDEGYEALLPNPPSVEEMRDFFRRRRTEYEQGLEG